MVVVRAWLFALLATLLVLLPGGGAARSEHYCRMLGHVVTTCCCGDTARAPSATQELQVEDCCQRISAGTRSASLAVDKAVHAVSPAALVSPTVLLSGPAPGICTGSQCAESTQAPLAIGPPLFVKHCARLS